MFLVGLHRCRKCASERLVVWASDRLLAPFECDDCGRLAAHPCGPQYPAEVHPTSASMASWTRHLDDRLARLMH